MHAYSALLRRRHRMPVHTVLVALDRTAWGAANHGRVKFKSPIGRCHVDFRYELIRVWRLPAEQILAGGPGILPLAPIAKIQKQRTPEIVQQMAGRLDRELPRPEAAELWTATYVLVGLKYDRAFARVLLRGVREIMKESTTYQEIVEEGFEQGKVQGRAEMRQDDLILMGTRRFGTEPDDSTVAAIRRTNDLEQLELMLLRVFEVEGWKDLLDGMSD